MSTRNAFIITFALGSVLAALSVAAATERVRVNWTNPDEFAEAKQDPEYGRGRHQAPEWLEELAKSLRRRADSLLPPGDTLAVTFTDVKRAGIYEPWRGPQWDDIRIIKPAFPPRIDLQFTLRDADGGVVREGERKLRDPGFMQRSVSNHTDPLRYEKRMIDDWLRDEFAKKKD